MDKGGLTIETRTGQSVRVDTQGAEAEGNAVAAALGQAVEVTGAVSPERRASCPLVPARQAVVGVLVGRPVMAGGHNIRLCRPVQDRSMRSPTAALGEYRSLFRETAGQLAQAEGGSWRRIPRFCAAATGIPRASGRPPAVRRHRRIPRRSRRRAATIPSPSLGRRREFADALERERHPQRRRRLGLADDRRDARDERGNAEPRHDVDGRAC